MAEAKSVFISYLDRNKVICIPPTSTSDVHYIESQFKSVFSFGKNVKLQVTFQRFDSEWQEFIDLEEKDIVNNKDKLKAVVLPLLQDPEAILTVSETPHKNYLVFLRSKISSV